MCRGAGAKFFSCSKSGASPSSNANSVKIYNAISNQFVLKKKNTIFLFYKRTSLVLQL
jgi:hypothetical protein